MKVDPKTGIRYAHTPAEWAEVLRRHGAGMSLPGSVAARIGPASRMLATPHQPDRVESGGKKDE